MGNKDMTEPGTKTCTKCGRSLPIARFGVDRRSLSDGLKSYCMDCTPGVSIQLESSIQASRESGIYRSGIEGKWIVKANGVKYPQESYSEARRFLLEWRQTRAMEIYADAQAAK